MKHFGIGRNYDKKNGFSYCHCSYELGLGGVRTLDYKRQPFCIVEQLK